MHKVQSLASGVSAPKNVSQVLTEDPEGVTQPSGDPS